MAGGRAVLLWSGEFGVVDAVEDDVGVAAAEDAVGDAAVAVTAVVAADDVVAPCASCLTSAALEIRMADRAPGQAEEWDVGAKGVTMGGSAPQGVGHKPDDHYTAGL